MKTRIANIIININKLRNIASNKLVALDKENKEEKKRLLKEIKMYKNTTKVLSRVLKGIK